MKRLIDKLANENILSPEEFLYLFENQDTENTLYLFKKADEVRKKYYGNKVYIRGLIEFTNYCKNNCYYCGIRCGNKNASRYRLSEEEILMCCKTGYDAGFRTFVLQGGEDPYYTADKICSVVSKIRKLYPDCAITLSAGEFSRKDYEAFFNAGATRYLLRHETASKNHYEKLHPKELSWDNRMECLKNLKEIGFQTGCGMMIGSPYQTYNDIINDLIFIHDFKPHMVGIGPFIPHHDTPFASMEKGSGNLTLFTVALVRLILPNVLLPATTALGTIMENGREMGILAGCNVCMPNISPSDAKTKYTLYDNKLITGAESLSGKESLKERLNSIGYEIVTDRGDFKEHPNMF